MATKRKPRELNGKDIVLSHFTLGRHHDIENRVASAARAECAGMGLYIRDYQRIAQERSPIWLAGLLDEHNLCLAEIEALRGWDTHQVDDSSEYEQLEGVAFAMADAFDCRYVQAIGPYRGTVQEAGEAFGRLCDRAANHGLVVGLEFLPFTNIFDADDAMRIVEIADRDNGGVCVDIWHHQRGANDLDLIRAIPGDRVMAVQMSDGPLQPTLDTYYEDCLRTRVPPGLGQMDVVGFIEAIRQTGANVPWDIEVCNDDVWDADGRRWVQQCADGLRALL